jgi:hypothetical protein
VYNIPNMRVGGPYRITATAIGFEPGRDTVSNLNLGENRRVDFGLERQAVRLEELEVTAAEDEVLNGGRNGAATFIGPEEVDALPSIKRSTRDLIRIDPRNDGNYAFAGRNWLYNDISLDGSYFNNPYGLDDPAPGGQTNAEPVPYDAVEQVQVSVAPFDVRQGGFTGASINTVTKSGTNDFRATLYSFYRNDGLQGNEVRGSPVVANPDLSFIQSGIRVQRPDHSRQALLLRERRAGADRRPRHQFRRGAAGAVRVRSVAGGRGHHGRHQRAAPHRVRLRDRAVRGIHSRDRQQQDSGQARLEHQPEQQSHIPLELPRRQT